MGAAIATRIVAAALSLVAPLPIATVAGPAIGAERDTLAGLWEAKRRYGPDAAGPLLIERQGGVLTADFVGRRMPVTLEGRRIAFALPDGLGRFQGSLDRRGGISGQWIQPRSPVHGVSFASMVRFAPAGPNRWRGEVRPLPDDFTLYLAITERGDGSVTAFLRNPERNIGVFQTVERIARDGDTVRLIGKRRGRTAEEVLASGRYDARAGMMSIAIPSAGGTFDFRRATDDSGFYPRGGRPARYVYRPPPRRDDGWPVGTLEEVGIDRRGIESFVQMILDTPMDGVRAPQVEGMLIARHGKLVLEEYFHNEHRDKLHDTRSAGKSVIATLAGAAMHAGVPIDPSTGVYDMMYGGAPPPGLDPAKRGMRLEHLLTMTSGIFCDDRNPKAPGNEEVIHEQEDEPDSYRYYLPLPMDRRPGQRAVYCSGDPNLAGGVVARAAGEPLLDLFDRLVARPLGIERYAWPLDRAGQAYGGGGMRFLPRDFMKLGQLMLNGGIWNGRRILDARFVERASSRLYPLKNIHYGYNWWNIDYPYKDRTVTAFFAGGNGGQSAMVIPELDLVIATWGGNYSDRAGLEIQQAYPPRYILPAVREPGDRTDSPVAPRAYSLVYELPPGF